MILIVWAIIFTSVFLYFWDLPVSCKFENVWGKWQKQVMDRIWQALPRGLRSHGPGVEGSCVVIIYFSVESTSSSQHGEDTRRMLWTVGKSKETCRPDWDQESPVTQLHIPICTLNPGTKQVTWEHGLRTNRGESESKLIKGGKKNQRAGSEQTRSHVKLSKCVLSLRSWENGKDLGQ